MFILFVILFMFFYNGLLGLLYFFLHFFITLGQFFQRLVVHLRRHHGGSSHRHLTHFFVHGSGFLLRSLRGGNGSGTHVIIQVGRFRGLLSFGGFFRFFGFFVIQFGFFCFFERLFQEIGVDFTSFFLGIQIKRLF